MKYIVIIFVLFTLSVCLSQPEMSRQGEREGPQFFYDVVNSAVFENETSVPTVQVYVEILLDELQFIKIAEGYEAKYELSMVLYDRKGEQIDGKIKQETVFVDNYDQTNSRDIFTLAHAQFTGLESGTYSISVSILDEETQLTSTSKKKCKIREYPELSVSDILFANKIDLDSTGLKIRPQVTNPGKGLYENSFAYIEIYNMSELKECEIRYEMFGEQTKAKIEKRKVKKLVPGENFDYYKIPVDSLNHDTYRMRVSVSGQKQADQAEKLFYIRWKGLPSNAKDLDSAIEQLKYIASRQEWKKLKKLKGDERLKEFIAFWKRHDPTPGTTANEAMEAHYARIEYANRHFSVMQREGWQTDMGLLYILLGAPDDIQRNAYPINQKPYEIWQYYRINREFVFYDDTGFGDYRFASPYSIYEIQRYIRD
ncbi:GWxTD domain-containing protein [candidate division KSB1 bacterium]|nr:GWxTD domain-containing protein [candidate division KSB1 bacterium]